MIESVFKSPCQFYDAVNFPHGFNRAGVFTKSEADILSDCGYQIKQLMDGKVPAESKEHKRMLKVIQGKEYAESSIEKAWQKYLALTTGPKTIRYTGLCSNDSDYDYQDDTAW